MKRLLAYIILFSVVFYTDAAGQVSGVIIDSATNTPLAGATVAVYRTKDTALLAYMLSNPKGHFVFGGLPSNRSLTIIVSYISHRSYEATFVIDSIAKRVDIGSIYLPISNDKLSDVVVTAIPPVRMNGDTLEFNADAFKLDPTAQTEDLLRVLPGVTVWADGVITVNGQEVKSIMVNGKPFFGGAFKVATQNIPKDAVEKIQVYEKRKDSTEQGKDSTTEINIRLKNGKDVGYFGKVSGGYGTNATYAGDAVINFFNSRNQLGIGLAHNNINKIARYMSQLLENTTFKGNGSGTDYESDFTLPGKNIFTAGGALVQHDFIAKTDNNHIDRLNGEYFFNNTHFSDKNNSQTLTNEGGGQILNQQNSGVENDQTFAQSATARYEKKVGGSQLAVSGSFSGLDSRANSMVTTGTADVNSNPLSTNTISSYNHNRSDTYNFSASYSHSMMNAPDRNFLSEYAVLFQSNNSYPRQNRNLSSYYMALAGIPDTRRLSRSYNTTMSDQANSLLVSLPNVAAGLLKGGFWSNSRLGFKNELKVNTSRNVSVVKDLDSLTGLYESDAYLTNNRHEIDIDESPSLLLATHYSALFSSELSVGPQYHSLHSYSQNAQQQLYRNYQLPVVAAKFDFYRMKLRRYTNQMTATVGSTYTYPTLEQLAPLVDSSNLNWIQAGNLRLKPQNDRRADFMWWHTSLKRKNPFSYKIAAGAGYAVDFIAVRNKVDSLGRTVSSPVNAGGYYFLSLGGELRKSYQWRSGQLQLALFPAWSASRSPVYLDDTLYYFHNQSYSLKPVVTYEYNALFTSNISVKFSKSINKNAEKDNVPLVNETVQSEVNMLVNCTKRFSIGTDAISVNNAFGAGNQTVYTILNAQMIYRLLKDHTAELKFSGMDLLNQNAGLNNYGAVNSLTKSETSMLGRYYMVTFAWYPRKFGK